MDKNKTGLFYCPYRVSAFFESIFDVLLFLICVFLLCDHGVELTKKSSSDP